MRNQKGITLIALVITIIVLLILAGVSIAMLTGDNGILTQTNKAKVAQIEGQVKEEVNLAIQAAKMYAEEQAVSTPTGYSADAHLASTKDDVLDEMREDLGTDATDKGYTLNGTNATDSAKGSISIIYTTDSYKSATNNSSAQITFTIEVSGNTFEITKIEGSKTINMGPTV